MALPPLQSRQIICFR